MSAPPPLAPERTALAWRRTAAALLVLGLLLVRVALVEDGGVVAVVAGSVAVVIAFAVVVTPAKDTMGDRPADGRRPAAVGVGIGALALTVVVLALQR